MEMLTKKLTAREGSFMMWRSAREMGLTLDAMVKGCRLPDVVKNAKVTGSWENNALFFCRKDFIRRVLNSRYDSGVGGAYLAIIDSNGPSKEELVSIAETIKSMRSNARWVRDGTITQQEMRTALYTAQSSATGFHSRYVSGKKAAKPPSIIVGRIEGGDDSARKYGMDGARMHISPNWIRSVHKHDLQRWVMQDGKDEHKMFTCSARPIKPLFAVAEGVSMWAVTAVGIKDHSWDAKPKTYCGYLTRWIGTRTTFIGFGKTPTASFEAIRQKIEEEFYRNI